MTEMRLKKCEAGRILIPEKRKPRNPLNFGRSQESRASIYIQQGNYSYVLTSNQHYHDQ